MKKIMILPALLCVTLLAQTTVVAASSAKTTAAAEEDSSRQTTDKTETADETKTGIADETKTETADETKTETADETKTGTADETKRETADETKELDSSDIPEDLIAAVTEEVTDEFNVAKKASTVYDSYITNSIDSNDLPSSFDLRDKGVVTPVKQQAPFGTCWAFGTIAASEISILSKLGLTCEEFEEKYGYPMDLSERQVAYFVHNAIPESESEENHDQGGEGTRYVNEYLNKEMTGGYAVQAGDIFSDGTGPVFEATVPYQGQEGITARETTSRGYKVLCFSKEDDWSVAEEYRYARDFEQIDYTELVSPAYIDEDENYYYDPYGTYDIKSALYDGYGVSIAFHADNSMPGKPSTSAYMNTSGDKPTWAQYTYDVAAPNHEVCIVGWDDDYPASNFTEGHQPPADGAWIVKNSWGSVNSDKMNYCDWGYEGSGYFYLSYYDESIHSPTIFDFDVSGFLEGNKQETEIAEYDYTVTNVLCSVPFDTEVASANVFTVDEDSTLTSVGVCTRDYDSSVVYFIYKLSENSDDPQDGTLLTSHSVPFEYAGFHRITLPLPISFERGDRIAVVVKNVKTAEDASRTYTLRVNAVLNEDGALLLANPSEPESYDDTLYQKAVINPGESYVLYKEQWYDWKDVADAINAGGGDCRYVDFDNFSIKAYFQAGGSEADSEEND